jgi:hypothetical protein
MNKRFLLTATGSILLSLFFFTVPAKADTLLVGTPLTNTNAGPVLCPKVDGCDIEFSNSAHQWPSLSTILKSSWAPLQYLATAPMETSM